LSAASAKELDIAHPLTNAERLRVFEHIRIFLRPCAAEVHGGLDDSAPAKYSTAKRLGQNLALPKVNPLTDITYAIIKKKYSR
jgi:hypothetical protein